MKWNQKYLAVFGMFFLLGLFCSAAGCGWGKASAEGKEQGTFADQTILTQRNRLDGIQDKERGEENLPPPCSYERAGNHRRVCFFRGI